MSHPPIDPPLRNAWRHHVPSIKDEEIRALFPIIQAGHGRLRALVLAYRAGVRDTTPLPPPLSGFAPCPLCLSVSVAGVVLPCEASGYRMLAHCATCGGYYVAGTGEPADSPDAPAIPAGPAPEGGTGRPGHADSAGAP